MNLLRFFLCLLLLYPLADYPTSLSAETAEAPRAGVTAQVSLWTRLFVLDAVRKRVDTVGSLEVNYPSTRGRDVRITSLELVYNDRTYVNNPLSVSISGDGGWYSDLNRDMEKLPPETSYLYTNRRSFPLDHYKTLSPEERNVIHEDVLRRIESAREDPYFALHPPTELIKFTVPLTEMLSSEEFRPGVVIPMVVRLRYESEQGDGTLELTHEMTVLEPLPRGPEGVITQEDGDVINYQGTWHYGDLHVHDCKDEASIIGERGCPTCMAETLNWGDDNSLQEMKNQYIAMGSDWFTITSHSYCVESASEYNGIHSQANQLSGPSFLLMPDTELTSEEEGPQEGSDEGDLICWNGSNHMGAHWINSWKPGGQDGLLEICNDPISGFSSNIRDVRSEGGFGVINHPTAPNWGWNSYVNTHGFTHSDGLQGVEIWNGPTMQGSGAAVGWWVRKLLDGEPMYAYGGSDTHDDVFECGWNHVYVMGDFNKENLKEGLVRGRLYISNYQTLVVLIHDIATDRRAMMGGGLTVDAGSDVEVPIYYDFGTRTGTVTLYRGVVGESSETVIDQELSVAGSGWLYIPDTAPLTADLVYYRAYSSVTSGGIYSAYTNPVWYKVIPSIN